MKKLLTTLAGVATFCVGTAQAADGFEKVEGQVRENIPAAPFLAGAYGFIWVAVLVYVVVLARGLTRVQNEIEELRRRVQPGR